MTGRPDNGDPISKLQRTIYGKFTSDEQILKTTPLFPQPKRLDRVGLFLLSGPEQNRTETVQNRTGRRNKTGFSFFVMQLAGDQRLASDHLESPAGHGSAGEQPERRASAKGLLPPGRAWIHHCARPEFAGIKPIGSMRQTPGVWGLAPISHGWRRIGWLQVASRFILAV